MDAQSATDEPDFTLIRVAVLPEGAFGVLLSGTRGRPFVVTLERTYSQAEARPDLGGVWHEGAPGQWLKIAPGKYRCRRTVFHRGGYPTYELIVPGHTRILFHIANDESDVDGCIGVAEAFTDLGIGESRTGFADFLGRCGGRSEFTLDVREVR